MRDDVHREIDASALAFRDVLEMIEQSADALAGKRHEAGDTMPRYTSGRATVSGLVWSLDAGEPDGEETVRLHLDDERPEERELAIAWKQVTGMRVPAGQRWAWKVTATFEWEMSR